MTKQSLQLSVLTLVGSLKTSLRRRYSSVLESRNPFLLVADIYRRISFAPAKVGRFLPLIKRSAKHDTTQLRTNSKPTANTRLAPAGGQS